MITRGIALGVLLLFWIFTLLVLVGCTSPRQSEDEFFGGLSRNIYRGTP